MAKGLVSDTNLTAIANAIRSKNGSTDEYTPAQMATAISDIPASQVDEQSALKYMLENKTVYNGIAAGLTNLTELPTFTQPANVTEYHSAFQGCTSLEDASRLKIADGVPTSTSSVTITATNMFRGCSNLTDLPTIINYRQVNLSKIDYIFHSCSALTSINLTRYGNDGNPSATGVFQVNGTSGSYAFYDCTNLTDIAGTYNQTLGGAGSAENTSYMFSGCSSLQRVLFYVSNDTISLGSASAGINCRNMFSGCSSLTKLSETGSPMLKIFAESVLNMFDGCSSLTNISGIELAKPSRLSANTVSLFAMFRKCSSLASIDISANSTLKPSTIQAMFTDCSSLTTISQIDLSGVTGSLALSNAFSNCPSLSNDSLNNILASLATATSYNGTKTLKNIGLSSTQATTCTGLSNWAALSAAGWTTGY